MRGPGECSLPPSPDVDPRGSRRSAWQHSCSAFPRRATSMATSEQPVHVSHPRVDSWASPPPSPKNISNRPEAPGTLERDSEPDAAERLLDRRRQRPAAVIGLARKTLESVVARHADAALQSEEHTSELQSRSDLVCRLLLEKQKKKKKATEKKHQKKKQKNT